MSLRQSRLKVEGEEEILQCPKETNALPIAQKNLIAEESL